MAVAEEVGAAEEEEVGAAVELAAVAPELVAAVQAAVGVRAAVVQRFTG